MAVALTIAVSGLASSLHSSASAQGPAVGCGYGTGGPNASNLCWFDMSAYNDTLARSPAGQPMSVTLPGGYTVTYSITSRPVSGSPNHPIVDPRAVPIETRFAFGYSDYVGVAAMPALYSRDAGNNGVTLTLSNISVVDSSGVPVTGYSFVIADAENNINTENFTWTSDKPLELVGVANPTSTRGCHNALTGLGTTSVTCTGQGTDPGGSPPRPWYDAVVVGADTPSTISVAMRTPARSGVAFAIMTSKIEVVKNVAGRVRASDSFDIAATSPEGSTLATASTGPGNSATTGELTVLPRSGGSAYTLSEAVTPGSGTRASDYSRSWSCTNNGVSDPSLPAGSGPSVAVSPAAGDDVQCTVTNTQLSADLAVAKTVAPSPATPGANAVYTLRVTNSGPSRATNLRVSDPLPSGLSFVSASSGCSHASGTVVCTAGGLDPGATRTFTVTTRLASSARTCAQLRNTATVSSDTPDSDPSDNQSSLCAPIRGMSDLSITKSPSVAGLPVGGGQVMYTLVVRNRGPSDATDVTVVDPLGPGLTLLAADTSQGSCSTTGNRLSCDIGGLSDGGSAQVLVTAQALAAPFVIPNTATVSGDEEDPAPANNVASASITVAPGVAPQGRPTFDLRVTKTASQRAVSVGQPVTYKILVSNRGSSAAPGVRVTDTFSGAGSVASVKSSAGSCKKVIPMTCSLGTIGARRTVTITVVVRPSQSGCVQRNAASVTGAGTDLRVSNNLDTVDLCARRVALRVSKVADRSGLRAGELMSYTIGVRNPTNGVARDVEVCDRLPAGLVHVSSQPKAKFAAGRYCWTVRVLSAGASRSFRITVRALRGAFGSKVNRVTVDGGQVLGRTASATIHVSPATGSGVTG
ncbi:MAG TPA: DUF11 domain-containing protein [Baekduia sp.]|nr:DUF11 domain-containing protein [Baekduia sp.]